eukprot:491816-Pleurochrysis_carterae.AAC.1
MPVTASGVSQTALDIPDATATAATAPRRAWWRNTNQAATAHTRRGGAAAGHNTGRAEATIAREEALAADGPGDSTAAARTDGRSGRRTCGGTGQGDSRACAAITRRGSGARAAAAAK